MTVQIPPVSPGGETEYPMEEKQNTVPNDRSGETRQIPTAPNAEFSDKTDSGGERRSSGKSRARAEFCDKADSDSERRSSGESRASAEFSDKADSGGERRSSGKSRTSGRPKSGAAETCSKSISRSISCT